VSTDATKCSRYTDAGLTPGSVIATIPDDRLFTIAEVAVLLNVPKSVVYSACDRGQLQYVKFEGTVQVEGRDLQTWLASCHRPKPPATES
jgi:excisionase family DNA binding protein